MRTASIISAGLSGLVASQATNAPKLPANITDVSYKDELPQQAFFTSDALQGNVKGFITASAAPDGSGVKFKVRFENLPKEGGPFIYHIHVDPVPADGNCTKTLAHLDPFTRGEDPPCDTSNPETCQVGDLSGRYGKVIQDPFEAEYIDTFTTLTPGSQPFFGNRSIVFHFSNKTRITCANFAKLDLRTGGSGTPKPQPGTDCQLGPGQTATSDASATRTGAIVAGTGAASSPSDGSLPFTNSAAGNLRRLSLLLASAAVVACAL